MEVFIGEKIRKIRVLKGYSQTYMSDELKISQRAYSKIERNETKIDVKFIYEIASIFDVEPTDILSFNDEIFFKKREELNVNNLFFDEIKKVYEDRIRELRDEIIFLRNQLIRGNSQNRI